MLQIPISPASITTPEATACMQAYFRELSQRFGQQFDPRPVDSDVAAMTPPRGVFLIAGDALGCVVLRSGAEGIAPGMGEVKRLWVAPSARGQGLALRLMAAVEDEARTLGLTRLRLDTSRHLPRRRRCICAMVGPRSQPITAIRMPITGLKSACDQRLSNSADPTPPAAAIAASPVPASRS